MRTSRRPLPVTLDTPLLLLAVTGVAALLALLLVLRARHRKRAARRHVGLQLFDCLKAYAAWLDWYRDEPLLHRNPDDPTIPAALAQAREINDQWLPELSPVMLQLLRSHRELMRYFEEENLLRMAHPASARASADARYHQLRDKQDAVLDSLFLHCRQLIGNTETDWQRTRSDFSFSSGLSVPTRPSSPG
ncbi:MAG TPA: hypothetical protein VLK85_01790 [Ramlibacter sp.]|nr:hypothetical protein [Ramlibacter sp.]